MQVNVRPVILGSQFKVDVIATTPVAAVVNLGGIPHEIRNVGATTVYISTVAAVTTDDYELREGEWFSTSSNFYPRTDTGTSTLKLIQTK